MGHDTSTLRGKVKAIQDNKARLTEVSFDHVDINEKAARKIADGLRENNNIERLSLRNSNLSTLSVRHISDALCNIAITNTIQRLDLTDNSNVGTEAGKYLANVLLNNKVLEHLIVNNCGLEDDGTVAIATALCSNCTLVTLEVGTNGLTDQTAKQLGEMLKTNTRLEGLSLWQNDLTAEGANYLAEGLQINKTLLWLGLGSNRIAAQGVWALSESLRSGSPLLWLGLGGNSLEDRGVMHLASLLQEDCSYLQSLGLGGNDIQDEGIKILANALKSNTRLRSLGLGGNQIADEGGQAIGDMLTANHTLKKLLLSSNLLVCGIVKKTFLRDNAVVHISEGLRYNSGLELLLLADNPFGDDGGSSLAQVLCKENVTLRVLDIHGTRMAQHTEQKVVLQLQRLSKLTKLGSAYGSKSSHHRTAQVTSSQSSSRIVQDEGEARKMAREKQRQKFMSQALSHNTSAAQLY